MKKLSITLRLTIWYAFFMLLAVGIAWFSFMRAETEVTSRYFVKMLEDTSALAATEVHMTDQGLDFDDGLMEIENAHVTFYDADGSLIYGSDILEVPFTEGKHMVFEDGAGVQWRVYDAVISIDQWGAMRLRTYANADYAKRITDEISVAFYVIMPVMLAIAICGGFLLSRRAIQPVKKLIDHAEGIADAGDLNRRLPLPPTKDELYRLTSVFNGMLSRLEASFLREKRFTSDASHEMRTPVQAILLQAESALNQNANTADKHQALETILNRARGLSRLISTLLMLSRMDAGRLPMEFEQVDVKDILTAVSEEIGAKYADKNVRIAVNAAPSPFTCDQLMITRLVMNLAENACRHSHTGGQVVLSCEKTDSEIIISCRDFGEGIPPEALPHIFDRFYRLEAARHTEGAGLGLSIAQSIARLHGGDLRAESEYGEYTLFTAVFPVSKII